MADRIALSLPDGLVGRVDAVRGDVPRSRFVARALEAALGSGGEPASDSAPAGREHQPSAPPRASVPGEETAARRRYREFMERKARLEE